MKQALKKHTDIHNRPTERPNQKKKLNEIENFSYKFLSLYTGHIEWMDGRLSLSHYFLATSLLFFTFSLYSRFLSQYFLGYLSDKNKPKLADIGYFFRTHTHTMYNERKRKLINIDKMMTMVTWTIWIVKKNVKS